MDKKSKRRIKRGVNFNDEMGKGKYGCLGESKAFTYLGLSLQQKRTTFRQEHGKRLQSYNISLCI